MYKAIIFDMDGVILDTEKLFLKLWKQAGKDFSICIKDEHISKMRGGTIERAKIIFEEIFNKNINFYDVRGRREELKEEYIKKNGIPVKDGIEDLFKYIKNKNIKIGLATSTFESIATKYLKETGLYKYFDVIVCGDMIKNSKPAPDIYLETCKRLKLEPKNTLVFEDSKMGILSAHSAGCNVIMVIDIDDKYDDETEKKLIFKIDNYKQAINFLEKIKEN